MWIIFHQCCPSHVHKLNALNSKDLTLRAKTNNDKSSMWRIATWVAMKYCLQRTDTQVAQYHFAFTLQETSKDYSLCHSYCCSWKWALSLPFYTLWGRHQSPCCKHSQGILPQVKVIVVGNLMNAPMPLFTLTCQTFSWYHYKSHHNEWSDRLGTAGLYAVCPHITAWGIPAASPHNSSPPG